MNGLDMDRLTSTARRLYEVCCEDSDQRLVMGAILDVAQDAGMKVKVDQDSGELTISTGLRRHQGGLSVWDLEQVNG